VKNPSLDNPPKLFFAISLLLTVQSRPLEFWYRKIVISHSADHRPNVDQCWPQISTKFLPCSVNFRMLTSTKFLSRNVNFRMLPPTKFLSRSVDLRMLTSTKFLSRSVDLRMLISTMFLFCSACKTQNADTDYVSFLAADLGMLTSTYHFRQGGEIRMLISTMFLSRQPILECWHRLSFFLGVQNSDSRGHKETSSILADQ
jgi:hypothetical protein